MKSTVEQTPWSIGDVAARFGLETHVLRHWETVGLLGPARDTAGRRRYGADDIVRVAVVLRSKSAGMSLEQIAVLLDGEARGRREVLEAQVADLDRRMEEMARSRAMILHALECRAHDIATCPHFKAWVDDILDGTASRQPSRPVAPGRRTH